MYRLQMSVSWKTNNFELLVDPEIDQMFVETINKSMDTIRFDSIEKFKTQWFSTMNNIRDASISTVLLD